MSTRDMTVTVTVDEAEWDRLHDAAECAGMSVDTYIAWGVKILAAQTQIGKPSRLDDIRRLRAAPRPLDAIDEPESLAWTETFAERLSHRTAQFRND
ncbi:hypothetical protein BJY24_000042 [Nocardia transvalensis]|uniref:Uncharacterized protein n=1 Tax=Nocardia transvalensis TaxID=37333 RepID=A0A7W9UFZ1_9NOCA|nr:hypothetical protein [Nocardia transvalensis]MBB5911175.1 hypothetical protein [Nocardia transvalensis]